MRTIQTLFFCFTWLTAVVGQTTVSGPTPPLGQKTWIAAYDQNLRLLRDAGTYQLLLLFAAPAPAAQQELSFSLIRPAARIDTVNSMRIQIEGNDIHNGSFAVVETSNASSVQHLTPSSINIPVLAF